MAFPGGSNPPLAPGIDANVLRERDRIAAGLQTEVIQRIFAIGLDMQGTAAMTADPLVRRRIEQAIHGLDQLIKIVRNAVFALETGLKQQGLRAGIVQLCDQLSPVPDVTFRGPVDGALHPTASAELLDILDDALAVISHCWAPVNIDVTAADATFVALVRAVPRSAATAAGAPDEEFPGLRDRAAQAGMRIEIKPQPESVQISWHAA